MAGKPKRISAARALRHRAIPAEALLWKALRNRALGGFKFRRQHPIAPYVVDFACIACLLIVEVDGETHLSRTKVDRQRTAGLEAQGWHVLRFWNTEIYDELEAVKEAIYQQCVSRSSST
jgi:very-short-patch-repair endonuclease